MNKKTNSSKEVEGRLIGYLPYEGVCEIELDNGKIECYGFCLELAEKTRVHPDTFEHFLYKFLICHLSGHDVRVIDWFEVHPFRD